jgi:hypothetical protein
METKNYRSLWMGTMTAAAILLLTSYLYYNLMNDLPVNSADWLYKVLYSIVLGFALSYLCWKTKRIGRSHLLTGMMIGLLVSIIILGASRLIYLNSNETIICCQGSYCWVWVVQIMLATSAVAATGKTGGGSDD